MLIATGCATRSTDPRPIPTTRPAIEAEIALEREQIETWIGKPGPLLADEDPFAEPDAELEQIGHRMSALQDALDELNQEAEAEAKTRPN